MPTMTNSPERKGRKWLRIPIAILLGIVLAVIGAECGYRVWLRVNGHPYDAELVRNRFLEVQSRARDFVPRPAPAGVTDVVPENRAQQRLIHPYLGWEVFGSIEEMTADCERLQDPKTEDDYEILLVGGSVADVFGAYGADRLIRQLEADPKLKGKHVYFFKYARGGFKQPQTINAVQYMLTIGFKPECVLAIDGFNEVALSNDNAALSSSPILPSTIHWGALAMNGIVDRESIALAGRIVNNLRQVDQMTTTALNSGTWHSAILGRIAERRLHGIEEETKGMTGEYYKRTRELGKYVLSGPPFRGAGLPAIEDGIRAWSEGSRSLRAICEARGIKYVHVLQPTLHDEGSKPVTEDEIQKGAIGKNWMEAVKLGYPLLRAEGQKLAEGGETYLDGTQVFKDHAETLYYDGCHFDREGNKIFADWIAAEMLKRW